MRFRRDSDIYSPYGSKEELLAEIWKNKSSHEVEQQVNERLKEKKNMAVAFISNCGNTNHAIQRLYTLQALIGLGLKIDRFGKCFPGPQISRNKMEGLIGQYKFYLAFENSLHCKDYITEKFFKNALRFGAVPVVKGVTKEDYDAVAPPHSYIFAEDFASNAQLVDYLKYLDKNDTAYSEYFKWRTVSPQKQTRYTTKFCQLCRILHGVNIDRWQHLKSNRTNSTPMFGYSKRPRIVHSLSDWFFGAENKECLKFP